MIELKKYYKQISWLQRKYLLPLKLRKWLSRDVPALYSHFEEKQRVQIVDLVRIAFTECDGSIRAGSYRINKKDIRK
ncbi:hypothetical protein CLOSPO_02963 [Clostridium sporogenes ATCC 15579]|nr:hypothetical protein CLOSPO_02963 [Clostridium sporogenes ATCC 15579]